MKKLVLLGYPVSHSISPAFQQAALDHLGIQAQYSVFPTPVEELEDRVRLLRTDEYLGANVTIPLKERVVKLLDSMDPWAEQIGAVNTIVKTDRKLIGHNTDADGFIRSLQTVGGFKTQGKTAMLIGAGGVARAATFAMIKGKAYSLTLTDVLSERAEVLATAARYLGMHVKVVAVNSQDFQDAARHSDLIVNCTPIGMSYGPAEGQTPLEPRLIRSGAFVYDMVYTPADTPLLMAARQAGARTLGGLAMLVFQGAAAFELWTGQKAPLDVMFKAAEAALTATQAKKTT